MDNFVALSEISGEVYDDLAQNGARILFDLDVENYRLVDGFKDETLSHFLIDFTSDKIYLISIDVSYELVTMYYCGGDRSYLVSCLDSITLSV